MVTNQLYVSICPDCKSERSLRYRPGRDLNRLCHSCAAIGKKRPREPIHGLTAHPLHGVWATMKARCYRVECERYKNYGARGISVCPEWHDFVPFYDWALAHGYEPGLQLDRENNDGNYEPANCRFVTGVVNSWNKQNSRLSPEDAGEIKAFYRAGVSAKELGRAYEIPYRYVHKIGYGQIWAQAPTADYLCLPC